MLACAPALAGNPLFVAQALLPARFSAAAPVTTNDISERARKLHFSSLVVDTHADTTQRFLGGQFAADGTFHPNLQFDFAARDARGSVDIPRMREGGLDALFFSIWISPKVKGPPAVKHALEQIAAVHEEVRLHSADLAFAATAEEVRAAHQQGKIAALIGIEGGHMINSDLAVLRKFFAQGARYMTLTHARNVEWADSSGDTPVHNGLTAFGREVIHEMNRLGMMVDISHVADKTFWDAIAATKAPVIASHSSARALSNAPRNMTDDMLRAVAKNGGVVDVNFFSGFDDQSYGDANKAQQKERDAAVKEYLDKLKAEGKTPSYMDEEHIQRQWMAKIPRPPFKVLIDQIDHIAKVAGVDHVGLGSDFDGVSGQTPEGMDSAADLPKITQGLLDRGYSAEDIHKILGGNVLRVFAEVERVSREMQKDQAGK